MKYIGTNLKIITVLLLQVLVIFFLGKEIYDKKIRSSISINPIKRGNILVEPTSKLKYFYEPKPNSQQIEKPAWSKKEFVYNINADALNEEINFSTNKDQHVFRVITLGDSHTFGLYVQQNENWSKVLESELNSQCGDKKYEVINLGVSGYDIQYSIERYSIRGEKYNPDLVVWFIKGDDFTQINEDMIKIKSDLKKVNSDKTGVELWDLSWDELKNQFGEEKLVKKNSSLINDITEHYLGKLIIMTYPQLKKEHIELLDKFVKTRKNTHIFKDIPAIYLRNDLNFYPNDYHPNKKGHIEIAENLFKYLINIREIPCK